MVEVPGGLAVGSRSNHGRRTTPRKLEGRLEKDERMVSRSPRMARVQICKVYISRLLRDKLVYFINKIRGEVWCLLKTCVTIPFKSLDWSLPANPFTPKKDYMKAYSTLYSMINKFPLLNDPNLPVPDQVRVSFLKIIEIKLNKTWFFEFHVSFTWNYCVK